MKGSGPAADRDLAEALAEALDGGPAWRRALPGILGPLERGLRRLDPHAARVLRARVRRSEWAEQRITELRYAAGKGDLAETLNWAFSWPDTPEGRGYWQALHDHMAGIVTEQEMRKMLKTIKARNYLWARRPDP